MHNDERLRTIEERIAWLERHVAEQDKAMLELVATNDRLERELVRLRSRLTADPSEQTGGAGLPEERPPHY